VETQLRAIVLGHFRHRHLVFAREERLKRESPSCPTAIRIAKLNAPAVLPIWRISEGGAPVSHDQRAPVRVSALRPLPHAFPQAETTHARRAHPTGSCQ